METIETFAAKLQESQEREQRLRKLRLKAILKPELEKLETPNADG